MSKIKNIVAVSCPRPEHRGTGTFMHTDGTAQMRAYAKAAREAGPTEYDIREREQMFQRVFRMVLDR